MLASWLLLLFLTAPSANTVEGDFNGDGKREVLTEHLINGTTGQGIVLDTSITDYDSAVSVLEAQTPVCRIASSDLSIQSIEISHWPSFGLLYMKNEGDLDGNGADDVGILVNWADYSQVNTYTVYSYKNGKWKEILNFEVREFDIYTAEGEKPFEGFLFRNAKGQLVARTYDKEASSINKVVKPSK